MRIASPNFNKQKMHHVRLASNHMATAPMLGSVHKSWSGARFCTTFPMTCIVLGARPTLCYILATRLCGETNDHTTLRLTYNIKVVASPSLHM